MVETSVNIPEGKIGLLIGPGGRTKKLIERTGGVRLDIDACLVSITGEDGFRVLKSAEVVRAIGEGLPVRKAFELFQEDYRLEVYDLEGAVANKSALERQQARIIGEKGKVKKYFERMLGLKIHIDKGKVIAMGPADKLRIFREALERLVHGASHSGVYRYVETRLMHIKPQNADIEAETE